MTQPIAEVAFAALLGGLVGLPLRAFRRSPLGGLIAFGVGAGTAWLLNAPWGGALLAALSGAALALLLPGIGRFRRDGRGAVPKDRCDLPDVDDRPERGIRLRPAAHRLVRQ